MGRIDPTLFETEEEWNLFVAHRYMQEIAPLAKINPLLYLIICARKLGMRSAKAPKTQKPC